MYVCNRKTDYIMSYFDNGEEFGGDSDENIDEAIYWSRWRRLHSPSECLWIWPVPQDRSSSDHCVTADGRICMQWISSHPIGWLLTERLNPRVTAGGLREDTEAQTSLLMQAIRA